VSDLVRFTVPNVDPVLVEIDNSGWGENATPNGVGPVGRPSRDSRDIPLAFENALHSVRAAAVVALDVFRRDLAPDQVTITFGVKMNATVGAVIARTAYEGNLGVELVWKREPDGRR
jgi:Trypsin-co-occurring domain 1